MNREVSLMMVCSSTCRVVVEHQDWRRDAQRTENESLDEGCSWRNKGVKGFKKYWGGKYVRWLGGNRKNEPNVTLMFSWLWQSQSRRETCECGKWWPWQCSPAVTHWHAYLSAGWCVFPTYFFRHRSGRSTMATAFQMTLRLKWLNKYAQVELGKC